MTDLTTRIEQAGEGEQRELLLDAWDVIAKSRGAAWAKENAGSFCAKIEVQAYLDAAMMLVPEGTEWNAGRFSDGTGTSSLWIDDMNEFTGDGVSTPALALLSAILRAGERG